MVFSGGKRLGVSGTIVVVCVANCNTYQLVFGCCFFITTSTILLAFFFRSGRRLPSRSNCLANVYLDQVNRRGLLYIVGKTVQTL